MYKSVSYSNMPMQAKRYGSSRGSQEVKKPDHRQDEVKETERAEQVALNENNTAEKKKQSVLPDNLETDDIILLIVAFVLLTEGCDDKVLLAAIAYVFLSGGALV